MTFVCVYPRGVRHDVLWERIPAVAKVQNIVEVPSLEARVLEDQQLLGAFSF